jgi:hypothetical protein
VPRIVDGRFSAVYGLSRVNSLCFSLGTLLNSIQYIWLSASSRVKGEADMKKFETAQKLRKKIKVGRGQVYMLFRLVLLVVYVLPHTSD